MFRNPCRMFRVWYPRSRSGPLRPGAKGWQTVREFIKLGWLKVLTFQVFRTGGRIRGRRDSPLSLAWMMRPQPRRMRTKQKPGIIVVLAVIMASATLTGALTGCGEKFRREKQVETEIVPEGTASGVTSTLLAPGEPAPPLAGTAPLTGTNADTTTSFTILDSNVSTSSTAGPGSLAGTLPLPSSNAPVSRPPSSSSSSSSPPAGQSVISIQRSEPAPATSQAEPVPAAEPAPAASSTPATPAANEPAPSAAEREPVEEEEEAGEPSPSPPPPSTTSTSTATNPD